MKFLFLEPFCGGSHRDFAKGWVAHSAHDIHLATLPARFWKWRMRGAALHFIRTVGDLSAYDGIVTTGLMSLADFKALCPGRCPPVLLYLHESQTTYPLAPGEQMDLQFVLPILLRPCVRTGFFSIQDFISITFSGRFPGLSAGCRNSSPTGPPRPSAARPLSSIRDAVSIRTFLNRNRCPTARPGRLESPLGIRQKPRGLLRRLGPGGAHGNRFSTGPSR